MLEFLFLSTYTHRSPLTHKVTPVGAHNLWSTDTFLTSLSGQLPLLGSMQMQLDEPTIWVSVRAGRAHST